jgi:hypothetical protein
MDSYKANPQIHANAVKKPKMAGCPFIDYGGKRVAEIKALREETRRLRKIEPLLYRSDYYDRSVQSLMLALTKGDDRPFVLSTRGSLPTMLRIFPYPSTIPRSTGFRA